MRILFFMLICVAVNAQNNLSWSVYIHKKGKAIDKNYINKQFNLNGFYLQRNCIYKFTFNNGEIIQGKIVDFKQDSIYFTNYFNSNIAKSLDEKLDTIHLHYKQLEKLMLISDRSMNLYQHYNLNKFEFIFSIDSLPNIFPEIKKQLYLDDTTRYEVVPYFTAQGFDLLYEANNQVYYYMGILPAKPTTKNVDTTYRKRNGLGLAPSNLNKLNGVSFGAYNNYNAGSDSTIINGLNIIVEPFSLMNSLGRPNIPNKAFDMDYYIDKVKPRTKIYINGVNIIPCVNSSLSVFRGVNITGYRTTICELSGVSISGMSNFAYISKGLQIAAMNRTAQMRGLQIGLFNKSADLKGFQIGLWNVNGKRKLPFINWQFKAAKNQN